MKNPVRPRNQIHTVKHLKKKAKLTVKNARPNHRKLLLHPLTVFILLCLGVFIANWTFRAAADSIIVTAKVSAPKLLQGATITKPNTNSNFTTSPIKVFGTCPTNSYVVLTRNSTMSGVALCSAGNIYEIETSLFPSTNMLNIQAYNFTNDAGPTTPEISVTYRQPTASFSSLQSQEPNQQTGLPIVTSLFSYNTFSVNSDFTWPIDITGGTTPYKVIAYWGDDTITDYSTSKSTSLSVKHRYSTAGYYKIKIKIVDANNNDSWLQLFAIIKPPVDPITGRGNLFNSTGTTIGQSPLQTLISQHWLQLAWGSYITVGIMTFSFWLGEQQQILHLVGQKAKVNRRYK